MVDVEKFSAIAAMLSMQRYLVGARLLVSLCKDFVSAELTYVCHTH